MIKGVKGVKVEKYRYYWDICNSNYTRALPYELQNIILSFIDPNTRMKILKALYYKKIKSKVNNITTNATASELYGIYKHITTFRSYGIVPEISAFDGGFCLCLDLFVITILLFVHFDDILHLCMLY